MLYYQIYFYPCQQYGRPDPSRVACSQRHLVGRERGRRYPERERRSEGGSVLLLDLRHLATEDLVGAGGLLPVDVVDRGLAEEVVEVLA